VDLRRESSGDHPHRAARERGDALQSGAAARSGLSARASEARYVARRSARCHTPNTRSPPAATC
jgi:hypothetical protein